MNKMMRWCPVAAMLAALVPMVWNFTPLTSGQRSEGVNLLNPRLQTRVGLENYDIRNDDSQEANNLLATIRAKSGKSKAVRESVRTEVRTAEADLRKRVPALRVEYNPDLHAPEVIGIDPLVRAFLAHPVGAGPGRKNAEFVRSFLSDNNALFSLALSQVTDLTVRADYTNPDSNLSFAVKDAPETTSDRRPNVEPFYKQDSPRGAGQDQDPGITLGTSYHNDTSPRLRDMVQVPLTPNKVGLGQSIKAPKAMTARGTDSGAILVSGVSADTNGEVGATQRVKIANKGYQIFDNRTGTSVLSLSDISTIWAGFGGSCATGGAGSAVVLYDKLADRWVISQFASATGGKAVTEECFAVSTTSDATGSYYRYAFHLGGNFIDSPHLSLRPDGYLMGDSVFNESGTERLGNQFFVFDRTAMLTGAAATFTSPGIDTGVGETYSISAHGVRLASAPGIVPAVSTLTINLTYDPDSTFTGAGLTAQNITDMKAANVFAAAQFTNNFNDPINVNIRVTAVPGISTLGGSSTFLASTTFANLRAKTIADATTADDTTATGAGGSVPAVDPVGGSHSYIVSLAQGKALGIIADSGTTPTDGTYTFGGGQSYTYDPNNRAVPGKYDYIAVSMHEFSEIMGRIGLMGQNLDGNPDYMHFDLFHYTGANVRGLNNGPGRFFSINNGTTLLKAFNDASVCANPCDLQDWASGTNDSFNAFSSSGVKNDLTAVDLRNMDVIGYNFVTGSSTLRIDTVSPPAGRTSGGQPIILTGAFAGLSTVTMGGVNAAWVYTNGSGDTSTITVTTPAHSVGAVQIDLTPTSGSVYSKPNAFAYLPTVFTDDTILATFTIAKAQHVIELRQAVDAMRLVAGLTSAPWTDLTLLPTSTFIKAVHILELRTFLNDAANRLGFSTSSYSDPTLTTGFLIKRIHIEELRQRIRTIAG